MITYLLISYLIGILAFLADCYLARPGMMFHALGFRIFLIVASPLTAWHAALHWGQVAYYKAMGKPVKFWF